MGVEGRPIALVTGAGERLGRELTLAAGHLGYDLAIHYNRSSGPAEETIGLAREIGAEARAFQADFSDPNFAADGLLERVAREMGPASLLINSASVYAPGDIRSTSIETLGEQLQVNLAAPFTLIGAFARSRGDEHGLVVNILDNKIAFHQYAYAAYLLSKKALADLTVMAALELAPGIRVNGIAPGVVLPAESRSAEYLEWRRQGIPLARQGGPGNIARALQYLVENDFVTGQILTVDGGESVTNTGRHSESFPG